MSRAKGSRTRSRPSPGAKGTGRPANRGRLAANRRDSRNLVRILDRTSLFKQAGAGGRASRFNLSRQTSIRFSSSHPATRISTLRGSNDIWSSRARWACARSSCSRRPTFRLTPVQFLEEASALQARAGQVELVNGRDPKSVACLAAYCGIGETVALVGSSGVGKSTLVNTLKGQIHRNAGCTRE